MLKRNTVTLMAILAIVVLAGIGVLLMQSSSISSSDAGGIMAGSGNNAIDTAVTLLQGFEGFSATAYPDPPNQSSKYSIGYGHQIRQGDPYDINYVMSQDEAIALLAQDVQGAYDCVMAHVTVTLTDNQTAALISFVYNVGCGAFIQSTMLKDINSGNFDSAAQQFPRWVNAGGQVNASLVARRASEQQLFQSA